MNPDTRPSPTGADAAHAGHAAHPDSPQTWGRFGSGQAVPRTEDDALLRGRGRYTDDAPPAGALCAVFLRSPHAHARIRAIDTGAAAAMPGVAAVFTGAQLAAAGVRPLAGLGAFRRADGQPAAAPPRRALAVDRACFAGEAVALVLAESRQQALDAAEAVFVDYDPLPAVTTAQALSAMPEAARLPGAAADHVAAEARHGDAAACDAAFARAAHVVRLSVHNQRLAPVTLEPRATSAWVADDGRLTLRTSNQMPSGVRAGLAAALPGLDAARIRVTVPDVGGGFGLKTGIQPEDVALAWAAWTLRRPVHWVAERGEDLLAGTHGRDLHQQAELALDADGRMLALRLRSRANVGATPVPTGVAIALTIGPWVQTGVYDIPVIDFHLQAVLTHTAPVGAYRGAGRPEAIFLIERLVDEAARQTGIDRIALRRRNLIHPQQMPYRNAMGQTYDSGAFGALMDRALAQADWAGFDGRARDSAARGLWRGLGVATFLEWTGGNQFEETVQLVVRGDGIVEVASAVNAMGQGIATTLAQLVVDVLELPIDRVRVVLGDTDRANGFGSAGSRSLFAGGSALHTGARRTVAAARALAAQALEVAAEDLDYSAGRFAVRGTDMGIDLFELAAGQPGGRLVVDSTSRVDGPSWPNGCHVCEVELDPATGAVRILRYASVNDVGRVIHPAIVRGQLDGGAVQGIGQALCEQVVYDEAGQLLTGSLMDYALPRADLMDCDFDTHCDESVPCRNNPLGVKGVGELGTIGATPTVVNAVADALARNGRADLAPLLQMPLTPARLWALLQRPPVGDGARDCA